MLKRELAIRLLIFNIMIGISLFFLVEALFGQLVKDLVSENEENSFILVLIIMFGFLLSMIVGVISVYLTRSFVNSKYVLIAVLLTFIINFILWFVISYVNTLDVLSDLSFLQKFVRMGKVFTIYAGMLYSPTLLWLLAQITFSLIYIGILVLIKAPITLKSRTKKRRMFV